jgi:hypothetical protein
MHYSNDGFSYFIDPAGAIFFTDPRIPDEGILARYHAFVKSGLTLRISRENIFESTMNAVMSLSPHDLQRQGHIKIHFNGELGQEGSGASANVIEL